jgi:tetratricopeptide (TPR) repeat protein
LIHAVSEQFFRQTINIGLSYYFAWKRLSTLIGSTILVILAFGGIAIITLGLAVAISFLLGSMGINIGYIIPVILMFLVFYFIISGAFVWEVALLEGLSSKAAVSRSYTLVKKNWWWISGRMFVLGIIISLVNAILGRIPGIGEIIGSILSTPFLVIGHILIYYDLRLRKEGYSVETLSEELNIKSDLKITKVWEDLSNEASTFYEQGKFPEADRRLQEALKAAEFALGPEHLEVSKILRNLAELFEAQGKYTEAEPLYKRVLNIREKALGPDHPDVANICENMGKCYRNMGKKGEAAKLEVRARQIRSK